VTSCRQTASISSKEGHGIGGELAMREISRRKPCLDHRGEPHIEQAVLDRLGQARLRPVRLVKELTKRGLAQAFSADQRKLLVHPRGQCTDDKILQTLTAMIYHVV